MNWEAGQAIVITTTAFKDARDWHQNEVATIKGVYKIRKGAAKASAARAVSVVEVAAPLSHEHWGGSEYQAEVGLLTRRIVIEGSAADSEPSKTSPVGCSDASYSSYPCETSFLDGFGGHIMVAGAAATGRFSGVELRRMGQTNVMARYPVHFHLIGDGGIRSFVHDVSIHRSYYRCVSVHGTHAVTVSRNVAYDAIGHCYYLEDGVEENNVFEYNLAAFVHPLGKMADARSNNQFISNVAQSADLLLPADITASGFYITNAYNTYVGNAASGGYVSKKVESGGG